MKYEILFFAANNGVWTRHDTLESAKRHIKMLTTDAKNILSWSISCDGSVVEQFKAKFNQNHLK